MEGLAPRKPFRFQDKVVIVMGAGAPPIQGWGNGKATAIAFAREGARVIAVDMMTDRAEETRAIIVKEGNSCIAMKADVTKAADVQAVVDSALNHYGRIDILHNNVGVSGGNHAFIGDTSEEAYDREMAVSAKSVFLCCKAVLPAMVRQKQGVITNTSSTLAARFIERPSFTYSAAKAAVEAMTRSLAVSHGPLGIRTNCVRIGFMDTPLNRSGWSQRLGGEEAYNVAIAASADAVPSKRVGTGWDSAAAALFLASDDASYLNGVVLPVDGGVEWAPIHIEGLVKKE